MAVSPVLKSVQLHIEGVGAVLLEKTPKARYMRISIRPEKGIRVSLPLRGSFDKAEAFVHEKLDWIKHHQQKIAQQENRQTIFTEETVFRTFSHELKLVPTEKPDVKARLHNGFLEISYPAYRPVTEASLQQTIRHAIEETYRHEAKVFLPQRVAFFAAKFGLKFGKVTVKKASSRWGSCSHTNNINLNLHLMRLPERLRDYVILHELAHITQKNHGPHFWALLESMCPSSRQLDNEMKTYRIGIF
ncbi:M48 family metallopeptidase [Adhaeribacter terreus]|uniref:M48 family metallopeptidase n=1 Tax=Adhaeribacter terreus TaxID=529703 RepID=A0ABW0EDB2_9BACT